MNNIEHIQSIQCKAKTSEDFCLVEQVEEALQACTAANVQSVMEMLENSKASKKEVMNHLHAIEIVECALSHLKYYIFKKLYDSLYKFKDLNLRRHFTNMCCLSGLMFIQEI